jgi:tetratricopeptide (TPR) repeat protein
MDECIATLVNAAELFADIAPETHPIAIRCKEKLGAAYQSALRWSDAQRVYEALLPLVVRATKPETAREVSVDLRLALGREALSDWDGLERGLSASLERMRALDIEDLDGAESQVAAHLAREYARRGDLDAARALLQRSLSLAGRAAKTSLTGAWAGFAAGVVAQAAGERERAQSEYEALYKLKPLPLHGACVPALACARLAELLAPTEPQRARELANQAQGELSRWLGDDHPETRRSSNFLASLH